MTLLHCRSSSQLPKTAGLCLDGSWRLLDAADRETIVPARTLWLMVGFLATACGIAGVILPLVPTTPFLLLAAVAFARSSPRLHEWLVNHPRLGPPIVDWRTHRAIGRRTKLVAVAMMAAALALSVAAGVQGSVVLLQAIVFAGVAAFVLTRPSVAGDGD